MSKKPKSPKVKDKKKVKVKKKGSGRVANILFLLILTPLLVVVLKMALILAIAGCLPSLVSYFMDNSAGKLRFKTIFLLNLCGVIPVIADILATQDHAAATNAAMTDPMAWLIMYSAAAIGYVMTFIFPSISGEVVKSWSEKRIENIKKTQIQLLEEWGEAVRPAIEREQS